MRHISRERDYDLNVLTLWRNSTEIEVCLLKSICLPQTCSKLLIDFRNLILAAPSDHHRPCIIQYLHDVRKFPGERSGRDFHLSLQISPTAAQAVVRPSLKMGLLPICQKPLRYKFSPLSEFCSELCWPRVFLTSEGAAVEMNFSLRIFNISRPLKDLGLKRSLLPPSASSRVRILIIVVIIIIIRISWRTATWCGRWK